MEENNTKQQEMSAFCEALMQTTEPIINLQQPDDAAMIICTDGKRVACRLGGSWIAAKTMVVAKMIADKKFAEFILSAASSYAAYSLQGEDVIKENATDYNETINSLN